MTQDEQTTRFDRLLALMPRRFHISTNPPFGVGLVLCGQVNDNDDDEDGSQFQAQRDGIANCKPGIWTSMTREVPKDNPDALDGGLECILRWVEPGTIDISQSVEKWEAYEKRTRGIDVEVKLSQIVPKGTKWRRAGGYFSDDGLCNIISTEYLTHEAAKAIQFGPEDEVDEEFGGYYDQITLQGLEPTLDANQHFTIGGMCFVQDEVGAPPRMAVAEEDGQVIAVRMYWHEDDDDEEGYEEGFDSEEE